MHMADSLISPALGLGGLAFAAAAIGLASSRLRGSDAGDPASMGVLGAFVFAAQMVNFAIPGTGSSGHLGGGLLLAALLGPESALLVMASVLALQALLFGDGGLLAWGCNVFNLGFLPAFVAYPLVFQPLEGPSGGVRFRVAALAGGMAALALGALAVVLEVGFSGVSRLPLGTFALFMLPIHLAIGLAEGAITAALLGWLWRLRPELSRPRGSAAGKPLAALALGALLAAGGLSLLASEKPDGLEWALSKAGAARATAPAPEEGSPRGLALALACVGLAGGLGLLSRRRNP